MFNGGQKRRVAVRVVVDVHLVLVVALDQNLREGFGGGRQTLGQVGVGHRTATAGRLQTFVGCAARDHRRGVVLRFVGVGRYHGRFE